MALLERSLSKLTITAYSSREMSQASLVGSLKAMYNPQTVSLSYVTDYQVDQFINTPQQTSRYQKARPSGLSLELIFDGSMPGNRVPVDEQLNKLREICCEVDAKTSQPYFLQIKWGKMRWNGLGYFAGRLASLAVHYTLFDRDATPLRANVSLSLTADESLILQKSLSQLKAPTNSVVTAPDLSSLALVATNVAETATVATNAYLLLAFNNSLNSINDISAGQTLTITNEDGEVV